MAERILIVDDEPQITRVLRAALSGQRYDVRTANDPEEALRVFAEWEPDLLITDLIMPEISGVDLCREIRKKSFTPIIVLSVRDQEQAKVEALDAGADDYVTKPFRTQELLARVRAHLRRAPERAEDTPIEAGDFMMDPAAHRVTVAGKSMHLTPKEFELLLFFVQNADKVLTHRALLGAVWGAQSTQPEHLRVLIGQLRKKLQAESGKEYIQTEPWVGYRFMPNGDVENSEL
jgi:two-component system KDP operon response regulator KdpE